LVYFFFGVLFIFTAAITTYDLKLNVTGTNDHVSELNFKNASLKKTIDTSKGILAGIKRQSKSNHLKNTVID